MNSSVAVDSEAEMFKVVEGIFYRTIDPLYRTSAIAGSRLAGRYSSSDQPTLYLSSTLEGVSAALGAHKENRAARQEIIDVEITSERIFDLRDETACRAAGVKLSDAISPWQDLVSQGLRPKSWGVRDRIIELGGKGLIDPSRQQPGLWHLVLFEWNRDPVPNVRVRGLNRPRR